MWQMYVDRDGHVVVLVPRAKDSWEVSVIMESYRLWYSMLEYITFVPVAGR